MRRQGVARFFNRKRDDRTGGDECRDRKEDGCESDELDEESDDRSEEERSRHEQLERAEISRVVGGRGEFQDEVVEGSGGDGGDPEQEEGDGVDGGGAAGVGMGDQEGDDRDDRGNKNLEADDEAVAAAVSKPAEAEAEQADGNVLHDDPEHQIAAADFETAAAERLEVWEEEQQSHTERARQTDAAEVAIRADETPGV